METETEEIKTRHCDYCNTDKEDRLVNLDYNSSKWICLFCKNDRYKSEYTLIKERHDTEETALIVDDYPYGFRLRTKIKYWIETTKNGDRFVSMTMNPKTGQWNAPKKSTYQDVEVLVRENKTGYIKSHAFSCAYTYKETLDLFLSFCEGYAFSEQQLKKFATARAVYKTREYIHITIRERSSDEEQEKKNDEEQKKIKQDINKLHYIHMKEEGAL